MRKSLESAILMRQSEADNPSGLRYYAKLGFIDRAVRRVRALWGAKLLLIPFKAHPLKTDTSCKSHYIPI